LKSPTRAVWRAAGADLFRRRAQLEGNGAGWQGPDLRAGGRGGGGDGSRPERAPHPPLSRPAPHPHLGPEDDEAQVEPDSHL